MSNQTFLVGGDSSKGVFACHLTPSGEIKILSTQKTGKGPSWIEPGKNNILYIAVEKDAKIETYSIEDRSQGTISPLSTPVSSHGESPCSLSYDPSGKWLAVANYSESNFVLLPLNEKGVPEDKNVQVIQVDEEPGPHEKRQEKSHCHQVQFHQGLLYVVDLGTDTVSSYKVDANTGALQLISPRFRTHGGAGPRHILFHPSKELAYLINEVDSTLIVCQVDATQGTLSTLQTISTREEKQDKEKLNEPAELQFSPDMRLLLASNRGDQNICIYSMDEGNQVKVKEHLDTRGKHARHFTFDPSGQFLLVAHEKSDNVVVFAYDKEKQTFKFVSETSGFEKPQHILFL